MTIDDLSFPVLEISQGSVSSSRNAHDLNTGFVTSIRRGYYRNLLIIDSTGTGYVVEDAEFEGRYTIFHRILELFIVRRVPIQLRFKEQYPISLDEMKRLLKKASKSLYDSGMDPGYNTMLRKGIKVASSTEEIVCLITKWEWGEL